MVNKEGYKLINHKLINHPLINYKLVPNNIINFFYTDYTDKNAWITLIDYTNYTNEVAIVYGE